MASINLAPNIPKLEANNYSSWAKDMKYVLLEKNCWGIVNKKEPKPESVDDKSAPKIHDWENRSRAALTTIYLNISSEYRCLIDGIDDPIVAWETLARHFQPDSRARHMALYSEILSCKIKPGETITLFASRLRKIADQLNDIKHPIPDEYLCFQFLRFLPDRFDHIVQSILRWEDTQFTFKDVVIEVTAEETRLDLRDVDKEKNSNEVEVQHVGAGSKFKSKKLVQCYKCGRYGHYQKYCRSKPQKLQNYRSPSPSFSNSSVSSCESKNSKTKTRKGNPSRKQKKSAKSSFFVEMASLNSCEDDENCWVFDTAASHHFCKNLDLIADYTPVENESMHVAVNGVTFPIFGKGTVTFENEGNVFEFKEVLYSPKLRKNLISGPRMDRGGAQFIGKHGKIKVCNNEGQVLFKAKLMGGNYYAFPNVQKSPTSKKVKFEASTVSHTTMELWHSRLAHVSPDLILDTVKNKAVKGLPFLKKDEGYCEPCQLNKQRRVSFRNWNYRDAKRPLERVFTDVCGPINVSGRGGERFFMSIIDEYSRYAVVYPMREKSQVFEILKKHITRAERLLNTKLKYIRSDNGGEYKNDNFKNYCETMGIKHEFTNVHSPEQNAVSERYNQTILNNVRTVLHDSGMQRKFWPDAAIYCSYTWNRICHKEQSVTPFQLYTGNKPSVRHMKPFGTVAFVGIPKATRNSKLDPKAKRGRMIGYSIKTKGYKIWIEEEQKIVETLNVVFKEAIRGRSDCSGAVQGPFSDKDEGENNQLVDLRIIEDPIAELPDSDSDVKDRVDILPASQPSTLPMPTLRKAIWVRLPKPRPDGSRTDIYYHEQGVKRKLRSHNDIKGYCEEKGIEFDPTLFDFSGSNDFKGIVDSTIIPSTSSANVYETES